MDSTQDTTKCTYSKEKKLGNSPHFHEEFRPIPKKIFDDALDAVGNTPLIRMNKVGF